jgi:hypothetical protein
VNSSKVELGYNAAAGGTAWQASRAHTIATDIPNPETEDNRGEPAFALGAPGSALIVWPARSGSGVEIRGQWVRY